MSPVSTLLVDASQFALVLSRIAGFVVLSPFPGQGVGNKQRVGLAIGLAWIASSIPAGPERQLPPFGLMLAGDVAVEIACGMVMGVAFRFVFAAAEMLGGMLGLATGMGSPSLFNPALEAQETPVGRAVTLLAMLLALGVGAHRVAISALLDSFRTVPIGTASMFDPALMTIVDLGIDAFVVGVRLSMPLVAVGLIVHLALAMISRAAPSLQIFSVGFGILLAATMLTLIASLGDLAAGLGAHFGQLGPALEGILEAVHR
jgi:flagellar biosynthetic protein FliR